jgi:hypothetical protein
MLSGLCLDHQIDLSAQPGATGNAAYVAIIRLRKRCIFVFFVSVDAATCDAIMRQDCG